MGEMIYKAIEEQVQSLSNIEIDKGWAQSQKTTIEDQNFKNQP